MRIAYLPTARSGLRWFRRYYAERFPEGGAAAATRLAAAERLLTEQPRVGRPVEPAPLRRVEVRRTPFHLLYLVRSERIEIVRVVDDRSHPSLTRLP